MVVHQGPSPQNRISSVNALMKLSVETAFDELFLSCVSSAYWWHYKPQPGTALAIFLLENIFGISPNPSPLQELNVTCPPTTKKTKQKQPAYQQQREKHWKLTALLTCL